MKIYDISVPLGPDTVAWPGTKPVAEQIVLMDMRRGDYANGSAWSLNSHAGTHVDAPLHFVPDGADVSETSLETYLGSCLVLDFPDVVGRDLEQDDLDSFEELRRHTRVLLKTSNSRRLLTLDRFDTEYVALGASGAELLVSLGYRLVGIDYLGIERFDAETAGHPTHRTLLENGVAILEGADLRAVEPGEYLLACLPLCLVGSEASPVRAVLLEVQPSDSWRKGC